MRVKRIFSKVTAVATIDSSDLDKSRHGMLGCLDLQLFLHRAVSQDNRQYKELIYPKSQRLPHLLQLDGVVATSQ